MYPSTVVREVAGVAGQTGDVEHLAVKERGHREKPGEGRQVTHEGLAANLLSEIELHVRLERWAGFGRLPDDRQGSVSERAFQVEVCAQFGRHERQHPLDHGTPREQVRARRLQPPRTGPEQDEALAACLDCPVDFVQECRQALHFVDDDGSAAGDRGQLRGKCRWVGEQVVEEALVEQVDEVGFRKGRTRPRALAHAPHAEQKEGALRRREQPTIGLGVYHAVILRRKVTAW